MSSHPAVDLRAILPPVRDQGPRPTCLAFAVTTSHEYERSASDPLSVESLHAGAKSRDGLDEKEGTTVPALLAALGEKGQCSEAAWPYNHPEPDLGKMIFYRARSENVANSSLVEVIRQHLEADHLAVVGLSITQAWMQPTTAGRIEPSLQDVDLGGHAVVAVGYDPADGAVLIRNSWGRPWALEGHAWLTEHYLSVYGLVVFITEPV